jgi:hypothetical protein
MITTEHEAKTRWCPFSRVAVDWLGESGTVAATANRGLTTPAYPRGSSDHANCLGSGCMAWRWWDDEEPEIFERRGYCGLAGCPTERD